MDGGTVRPIPQQRVREKLDAYLSRRDAGGARRHLLYWLDEAKLGGDLRGELMVRNELIGHCRKTGDRGGALEHIEAALNLLDRLDLGGSVTEGTTCVNAATALNAFGENARALDLFERARSVYEAAPAAEPSMLGGLYNNMGLCLAALRRYDEALSMYERALEAMSRVENGRLEQAVTCLNMANLFEDWLGMEAAEQRVYALLDRAVECLDAPGIPHDGYCAFVYEKCAPTFEYYGYFADAERLKREAERIYAGT